jgi:hypothetical protein
MLKAIGKKHRQVKEAEEFAAHQYREAKEAEKRALAAENELARARAQAQPPVEEVEPKREKFASEAEYIDARIKWGVDQGIKQREQERQEQTRQRTVAEQLARAAELVPDFRQVTEAPLNWPGAVAQYLRDSDMFAELGYHFAKHPKDLERIAALPVSKQLLDVARIEAKLQPFSAPKAEKDAPRSDDGAATKPPSTDTGFTPSKAREAPVIKPLSDSGRAVEPDPSSMSTREMIADFQRKKGINLSVRRRH